MSVFPSTHTLAELSACATWLTAQSARRVALQFPAEALRYAPSLLAALRAALPHPAPLLFIVGDTAFSPCCVDEVAAAHYAADAVVHFGATCLSPTARLPSFHVLAPPGPRWQHLDAEACGAAIAAHVIAAEVAGQHAVLAWDAEAAGSLRAVLAGVARALGGACTPPPAAEDCSKGGLVAWASPHPRLLVPGAQRCFGGAAAVAAPCATVEPAFARVCGLHLALDGLPPELCAALRCEASGVAEPAPLRMLYLGAQQARVRALLAAWGTCSGGVWRVDPSGGVAGGGANSGGGAVTFPLERLDGGPHARLLASRYRLVGLVKGAGAVGLVAGTLALEGRGELLDALRAALLRAGKAVHTLLVGKVTPAKLANFHGFCDVFVLVACPEASLLDGEEAAAHAVPVATPHEALVALEELAIEAEAEKAEEAVGEPPSAAPSRLAWDGALHLAFHALLGRLEGSRVAAGTARARLAAEAEAAAAAEKGAAPGTRALVTRLGGELFVHSGAVSDASQRLLRREWRGLAYDAPLGADGGAASTAIVAGRAGTASRYAGEPGSI